jgi:hypothetical protein
MLQHAAACARPVCAPAQGTSQRRSSAPTEQHYCAECLTAPSRAAIHREAAFTHGARTSCLASLSAPRSSSSRAHSSWPMLAAQCSGVKPSCERAAAPLAAQQYLVCLTCCSSRAPSRRRHRTAPKASPWRAERAAEGRSGAALAQQRCERPQPRRAPPSQRRAALRRSAPRQWRVRGVRTIMFLASLFAPPSSSSCTHSEWPLYAATCSGVCPSCTPRRARRSATPQCRAALKPACRRKRDSGALPLRRRSRGAAAVKRRAACRALSKPHAPSRLGARAGAGAVAQPETNSPEVAQRTRMRNRKPSYAARRGALRARSVRRPRPLNAWAAAASRAAERRSRMPERSDTP